MVSLFFDRGFVLYLVSLMHFFVGFEVVSFVALAFLSTNEVLHVLRCVPIHPTKSETHASADLGW